jgi:hypothetical protein
MSLLSPRFDEEMIRRFVIGAFGQFGQFGFDQGALSRGAVPSAKRPLRSTAMRMSNVEFRVSNGQSL